MYDTIKILGQANTFYDPEEMFWHTDWDVIETTKETLGEHWDNGIILHRDMKKRVMWKHKGTDLRIMGHRLEGFGDCEIANNPEHHDNLAVMNSIEYSLPKIINETNASLITTQHEIDAAQTRALAVIKSVCPDWKTSHYSRLDMVWHFDVDPYRMMQELKRLKHPQIRKETTEYNENESLIFRGKERKLRAYDKCKEMVNRKGPVSRVEVQLNGRALVNDFEHTKTRNVASIGADSLDNSTDSNKPDETVVRDRKLRNLPSFDAAFAYYREFLCKIDPTKTPKLSRLYDFLAHLNADETTFNHSGQPVIEAYLANLSPTSRTRVKREIRKHRLEWSEFSFRTLLPNRKSPPKPLHIHKTKREVLFETRPQRKVDHPQSSWSTANESPSQPVDSSTSASARVDLDKVQRAIA